MSCDTPTEETPAAEETPVEEEETPVEEEEISLDLDALPKMKVSEIKDILKALDLPTSGWIADIYLMFIVYLQCFVRYRVGQKNTHGLLFHLS